MDGGRTFPIPDMLRQTCQKDPGRMNWLKGLPRALATLQRRWQFAWDEPVYETEGSCAWVAPVRLADGRPAVLKLGMPHMEGAHEIKGLRFWHGDGIVRLYQADEELGAMVLERCEPGFHLRRLPEDEQDIVIAKLLRRLWKTPDPSHGFRSLHFMLSQWKETTLARREGWIDAGLVGEGLELIDQLCRSTMEPVLLATDLHAGNVLKAEREPWLAIDPKPFVGDRAYDATQHLLNCENRLLLNPKATVRRFSDLLEVDDERVRLWLFARVATETDWAWSDHQPALARALDPFS